MKVKNLLVVLSGLFSFQNLSAQYTISGMVRDEKTNEPIAGTTIYISELKIGSVSDLQGNYNILPVPSGTYLFEINGLGYKKRVERIAVKNDTLINFTLSESVTEINEIVVTGVSHSTELKLSPIIIKPIDRSELNESGSTNLIDALKNVPGVSQITTGAGISKPTIRGLGYNRVISLYNGIRQEGQQWGDEHGIEIDEYTVDRIEIVKGPGSLMYGSDGIAGVLNFISPKSPVPGKIKNQLTTNYQTNNQLLSYSFSSDGNKKGLQWQARLTNKYAGNYQNKYDGKVYNSGFREYDGSLFLGINRKWGYSHLNLSSFNTRLNMPEGERDSLGNFIYQKPGSDGELTEVTATEGDLRSYRVGIPNQQVQHLRLQLNNFLILKKGRLYVDLGFQNNKRKEFGDVLDPGLSSLFFDLYSWHYSLKYNFAEWKGWETSVGMGGMNQQNKNKGSEFLIPEYQLMDLGMFVFTQKKINKVTLAGGLRLDNRLIKTEQLILDSLSYPTEHLDSTTTIKFAALRRNYSSYSGSIGLTYQFNKMSTLKFNVSRGFRAPNIAEISSNGQHEGSLRYEYGSASLQPEISHQLDLAYFVNSDHFTFELTPFTNFISNYIFVQKLTSVLGGDSIPDPSDPSPAYQFTQGTATLVGGEIFMDMHPHPLDWLHLENSISYVQATQRHQSDSTKYLPFIPAPKYRGVIKAQFKKAGSLFTNVYVKLALDYFFPQDRFYKAYQTETATPSYYLLSAGVGGTIRVFKRSDAVNLFVSAENLTDQAYQSHLSRLKYAPLNPVTGRTGIFNMGRNISLKVIFNL